MDNLTKEQRIKNMKAIKSTNTKNEILLRKKLWQLGFRYRKNYTKIKGKPDIVFVKQKIAIFIDGEFWHGYNWEVNKSKLDTNKNYWIKKIERNMQRDREVNKALIESGWYVIRFWEKKLKEDIEKCSDIIKTKLENK